MGRRKWKAKKLEKKEKAQALQNYKGNSSPEKKHTDFIVKVTKYSFFLLIFSFITVNLKQ